MNFFILLLQKKNIKVRLIKCKVMLVYVGIFKDIYPDYQSGTLFHGILYLCSITDKLASFVFSVEKKRKVSLCACLLYYVDKT